MGRVDLNDMDWEAVASSGTVDELVAWGRDQHHIDLTDHDTVLSLAANASLNGAWRNDTELENIHIGLHKKRVQPKSGLRDAEMMVGNIETARIIRRHLASLDEYWDIELEEELCDFDRPYAGTPLSAHVTKAGLQEHRKRVRNNLWRYKQVENLVGRDRFLLGTALAAMDHVWWGSPLWPAKIDAWLVDPRATSKPDLDAVTQWKSDPTQLPMDVIQEAVTDLRHARGHHRWHQEHCGNPDHIPGDNVEVPPMWTITLWGRIPAWEAAALVGGLGA